MERAQSDRPVGPAGRRRLLLLLLVGALGAVLFLAAPRVLDVLQSSVAAPAEPPRVGRLRLERVADGFTAPVHLTASGDGSGRLFVVEQPGVIRVVTEGRARSEPFLDIRSRVSWGGEKGLLSVAFHPRYPENRRLFVDYTRRGPDGLQTVVAEYRAASEGPPRVDPESERVLLTVEQPWGNHNGGHVLFGPDGYLYVGMGDGGAARDPHENGEDPHTLLGTILRLDVDGEGGERGYAIPPDNPFVDGGGRPEVYAYGLRNPWRLAFDPDRPERLFAADVGQNRFEEVHLVEKGDHCGWDIMEGFHCHEPRVGCDRSGLALPIAEYGRGEGVSVTGGFVYRGEALPELAGTYVFTDYTSETSFFGLRETEAGEWERVRLGAHDFPVSSFGLDEGGEPYVLDYAGGVVYRVAGFEPAQ